ncbi:TetR/AcrR family transcriptional regulator [Eubacterium sp. 1001713B170207_170306_E7]|uniref:TetR/AcrR family transcriptional regulator n=1 Tax=Eubacterium sp. 1001713B170207_170306_E7 TaxID=2787097 RepID=UPI00189B8C92|nr:TetR/AcrR family transcriptional regulator [Eubacterium sp. 1001713B170207_170306_E7]
MAQYKNGIETKKRILQTAKELFYEHGYRQTTIAMIAEKAEIPVGLVNYYYKKEALVGNIYHEFILAINEMVEAQLSEQLENHLQKHILFNHIFYIKIFEDSASKSLYELLLTKDLVLKETHQYVRESMMAVISEFNLHIQKEVFQKLMIAEYGARKYLLKDCFETLDPSKSKNFINFLATITVRLAGVDTNIIEKNLKKADRLLKLLDTSDISFLVNQDC